MPDEVDPPVIRPLLKLDEDEVRRLQTLGDETGMGFYIAAADDGRHYAVLSDGVALPLQADLTYFDLPTLAAGIPMPRTTRPGAPSLNTVFATRAAASTALLALGIASHYAGSAGAFPLIATATLLIDTDFYRYLTSSVDPRYTPGALGGQSGHLSARTYLTTELDSTYANSGFSAVGRFALPIPLPAQHVLRYRLPAGTTVEIGTVSPLFGQAGGGVEIRLLTSQAVTMVRTSPLPAF